MREILFRGKREEVKETENNQTYFVYRRLRLTGSATEFFSEWQYIGEICAVSPLNACFLIDKESCRPITISPPDGFTGKATTGFQYTAALKSDVNERVYTEAPLIDEDPPIFEY